MTRGDGPKPGTGNTSNGNTPSSQRPGGKTASASMV